MTAYYNGQRHRNLYDPKSSNPYRLSRSKLDLFMRCPRCFYLDRRLGVGHPPGFPFTLNSAVDELLKREFDEYRMKGEAHPIMIRDEIDAIPYQSPKLEEWRDSLRRGITYHHRKTNFLITGGVDDVWVTSKGRLTVVDYKATSKKGEVSLDAEWQDGYKRQMELYQWLFRMNKFKVSDTGYFVYCNGDAGKSQFRSKLEFKITILPYQGDTGWIENAIVAAHACLNGNSIPKADEECDYCHYVESLQRVTANL